MGQYGGIIGGVVGAVVGFFAGGNVYAGWMIGSALGGAYSASQQVLPGPKIGDVQQQTSSEGGFRPIVYGRSHPISGNVIADGGPKIVTRRERQGKGGPKVESESAYRTYAVGFCEGEAQLLQAWRNGILVYDSEDPEMAAENAKFLEYATWYTGTFSQSASPDLEEIYGAGQAPFFRGTAYLSIHSEDVTDQRGAWSQWQVRVFRPYAWQPGDPLPPDIQLIRWDQSTRTGGTADFGNDSTSFMASSNAESFVTADTFVSSGDWYWEHTTGWFLHSGSGINHSGQGGIVRQSDTAHGFVLYQLGASDGGAWSASGVLFASQVLYPGWIPSAGPPGIVARIRNRLTFAGGQATWSVAVGGGAWTTIMSGVSGTFAPYARSRGTSQDVGVTQKRVHLYSRPEDFEYEFPAGSLPLGMVAGWSPEWPLPAVIKEISARASLPADRIDLSLMDAAKLVRGFTIGGAYPASGSLQALSAVFFFDPYSADGRLHFAPRGRDAVATILETDMIDDGQPVEDGNTSRGDAIAVPRVLHLNYYDVAGGLNTDKQRSERPEGTRAEGEQSLQTPVTLSADEAASVVATLHGLAVEQQKGELNYALPDNWLKLTESDAVFVQVGTKMVRAMLTRAETDDGEQRYKALRDRQSLYTTQVQGIPAAPVTRPPSSVAGPTLVEFLDVPIIRDADDMLGFRLAVSGILPAWPGALVELSLDGGEHYIDSQTTRVGSVMGQLVTALGDHPHPFPDTYNACQIEITTPNALLENTTLAGMMNRRNRAIIGNEIVNFADADEVTPRTWEVSHWLRGRRGTDAEAHSIGERFVMLDTTMFIPAELTWMGLDLTFRATTFGRPTEEATIITVPFTGQSQVERRPAYLSARRDGTDAVISWQGVGRLGGGVHVAMGAHFIGYRVTLTDGSTTQTHDTTANALTTSLAPFIGPVTVSVQQRNAFTGLGPDIEVTV